MERIEQEPGREDREARQLGEVASELIGNLGPVTERTGPARAGGGGAGICILYGKPFDLHAERPK